MSLLTLVQDAAEEVGVAQPSAVIGSTDPNVRLLLRFAQRGAETIAKRHDWSKLLTQYTVASLAAEAQTAFPSDFDRMNYLSSVWDRTINQRYIGPSHPNMWQYLKNGVVSGATGIIGYWRIIGGVLNLFPAPTAGHTLAFEYTSTKYATDSGGTPTTSGKFEADSNLSRVPERLITMDTVWRWKHRFGLDYAEDMSDFERALELDASRDRGLGIISVGGGGYDPVKATTWPGVVSS